MPEESGTAPIETLLRQMAEGFGPQAWPGPPATIQLRLTGAGGGTYHISLGAAGGTLEQGLAPNPNAVIEAETDDFMQMVTGEGEERFWPFLQGRMAIEGDMTLLMMMFADAGRS